jgi:hypothetical protein
MIHLDIVDNPNADKPEKSTSIDCFWPFARLVLYLSRGGDNCACVDLDDQDV